MGNSAGKAGRKLPSGGGTTAGCNAELAQPGQPKVSLASLDREIESEEVSDEVVLTWKPCTKRDKSYDIEMWDLGLQEWVHVSTTKSPECTLSNILSGILYRFRVTALTSEGGVSFPSDPSEPFVIDIPGVQIAPYWIQTPPTIISLTVNQTLTLSATALGTPPPNFHWYKNDEQIFIRNNLTIETTPDGSIMTIRHVESVDGGMYTCMAINTVGKCSWETTVDLKAKPAFTLPATLKRPIAFQIDELMSLKVPLIAIPEPVLTLEKLDAAGVAVEATFTQGESKEVRLKYRDNFAVIKIEDAQKWHTGQWRLTASNPIGTAEVGLHFLVRSAPDPPPEAPDVVETSPEGIVSLSWLSNPEDEQLYEDIQYQVEYNRETWDIWLKGCVTKLQTCQLKDLFPGSYYRFRVRCMSRSGISEPSRPSEAVFIGRPLEDELFGLPGGNYPKERPGIKKLFHSGIRNSKRYSSLAQDLGGLQSQEAVKPSLMLPAASTSSAASSEVTKKRKDRQFSLERDVYYFENNRREEVVTYDAGIGKKLGASAKHYGLNEDEEAVYKSSLGDLCGHLMRASQTRLTKEPTTNSSVMSRPRHPQRTLSLDKVFQRMDPSKSNSGLLNKSSEGAMSGQERSRLENSLSQLCLRLKSVSRENVSTGGKIKQNQEKQLDQRRNSSHSSLAMMKQKYPDSYPPMTPSKSSASATEATKNMTTDDAKQALTASCERIASLQNLMKSSTEALASLGKLDLTEKLAHREITKLLPPPKSPSKFREQPDQLKLAPAPISAPAEEEEPPQERQQIQRQNLLQNTFRFQQPKRKPANHLDLPASAFPMFKPILTPISSRTVTPTVPHSPNLSTTSKASSTGMASDATLRDQPSIETDDEASSRTLLATNNDTFDYSSDNCLSDISCDLP